MIEACLAELQRRPGILAALTDEFRDLLERVPLHPANSDLSSGAVMLYGLHDPEWARLRYIGYTRHPSQRYWSHIRQRREAHTHKNHWITELVDRGELPFMVALNTVAEGEQQECERSLIRLFSDFSLTNGTLGGDGVGGYVVTEDDRLRSAVAAHRRWDGVGAVDDHKRREEARRATYRLARHSETSRALISAANQGSNNHQAKLTLEDVQTIRRALADGALGTDMARQFGVSPSQITRIRRGTSWK